MKDVTWLAFHVLYATERHIMTDAGAVHIVQDTPRSLTLTVKALLSPPGELISFWTLQRGDH